MFADLSDLNNELAPDTAPPTAERTLRRAGRILDEMLIGVIYETDENGLPVDEDLIALLTEVQVCQAVYMLDRGDETGAREEWSSVSEGDVSLSRNANKSEPRYAPEAVNLLRTAGLLPIYPDTVGFGLGL